MTQIKTLFTLGTNVYCLAPGYLAAPLVVRRSNVILDDPQGNLNFDVACFCPDDASVMHVHCSGTVTLAQPPASLRCLEPPQ